VSLSPLERNLLAVLALSKGTVISTDRIIDSLWADRLPAAPRSRVQGLISSLRRKLGDALVTRHPGYLIEAGGTVIDLDQCEDLAQQARQASSPSKVAGYLRQALGLWRGEPLDGVSAPGIEFDRVRLAEMRINLLEERFAADIELGRHADVIGELTTTLAAHPLRERLAGQLMLALYRCNRQADALKVYHTLRERLAEELGSDPCADLRNLHATILRGEPVGLDPGERISMIHAASSFPTESPVADVPAVRPAQVPAGVGHFTGRDPELEGLTRAIHRPTDESSVLLISGAGGIGKTALVVRWAHTVADRFPDGQIFVHLHGQAQEGALSPGDALGVALGALGVVRGEIPDATDERAALYRTLCSGRKILIVADDAGTLEQVLALVPPTTTSQLVATSRSQLAALAAHHAVHALRVEPLSADATHDLLARIVGAQRLREPGARELVQWCGGWPLVIRLAGARIAARPWQSLGSLVEELGEFADQILDDDSRSLREALERAYMSLSPAAAYLFGRLCLGNSSLVTLYHPAPVVAPLVRRVRRLLDELIAAHLIVELGPDRYRIHDVVRRFATRCGADLIDRDAVDEWMRHVGLTDCRVVNSQRI
jgi:DNA-binding SARP family transcriptional activator